MKIKKVDDRAETQPIDDIADRAADDEADRGGEKGRANPAEPDDQDEDDRQGGEREDQRIDPGAVEEAKADSRIAGQHEVEKRADHGSMKGATGLAEKCQHQRLAYLIEDRGCRCHAEAAPEHHPESAALAPQSRTSAQRRQRSSWPATWPTSGNTRQQRSQRCPVGGPTTTPISATSGSVNAPSGGAPARAVPAEVMHSSARSTSRSNGRSRSGTNNSTAACRLEPMRFAARSTSRAPVTTRRTSRSSAQRAPSAGSCQALGTSRNNSRWTLCPGTSPWRASQASSEVKARIGASQRTRQSKVRSSTVRVARRPLSSTPSQYSRSL